MVCGPAGSGKTVFGLEFVARGAAELGEPGIYFSFEETKEKIHRNIFSLGLDPEALTKEGKLHVDYADVRPENPNANGVRAYFGDDPALHETRSPVTHAHLCRVPAMLAVAEFENPLLDVYGAEMAWRLAAAQGRAPHFVRLRRHNHISMVAHFNTGEDYLGREILAFIEAGR